ncbi:DNA-binding protein [Haloplanus sp. C73]|uniref:DNA-binding protein n=1 Tax=Haloplanus sp. C73 TaxID=3421641 RepID=UPI003EBADB4E
MSDRNAIAEEVWVDEQIERTRERREADATQDDTPELRASVAQDSQGKVDHADDEWVDDGDRLFGQTLAEEEQLQAREWEIKRTRRRLDDRQTSDREARTRQVVREQARTRHAQTSLVDAREFLSQDELAAVNQQAQRLCERLSGRLSRAMLGRRLAEHVLAGRELFEAAIQVAEDEQLAPGRIIPIEAVPEVDREEVSIEGEVKTLFETSGSVQQAGLIGDDTAKTKFTVWKKSRQPTVREGERVRFRAAKVSWYRGQWSVALTSTSQVVFPDRGRWWDA